MKKLLFLLFGCLFSASTAGAWGLVTEFTKLQPEQYRRNDGFRRSLIADFILKNKKEVKVCLTGYLGDDAQKQALNNVQYALDEIFRFTREQIEQSGRKQEFQDFLSAWPSKVSVVRVDYPRGKSCDAVVGKFDIEVWVNPSTSIPIEGGFGGLHYGPRGHTQTIRNEKGYFKMMLPIDQYTEDNKSVALHEMSHILGLADQYKAEAPDETYSLRKFEDITKIKSIMNGGVHTPLYCDDVEGYINAVDFMWRRDGKTSNRLQHGWADLCGRNYIYMDGVPQRNADPAQAKQEHDAFVKWATNGYKAADKPAFASKALEVQRDLAARLAGATKNLSALKDRKTELEGLITSKKYEIQNAKFYKWTPRQVKAEQAKLKKLEAERDQVAQDIAQLESNIKTGKFPEFSPKDTPALTAPTTGKKEEASLSSKSTPVISGNYVGPQGAQVVAATPKTTKPAQRETPKVANTAPKAAAQQPQAQPGATPVQPKTAQPVRVSNNPKAALDRYIAAHPELRESLLAVRTGTALPSQAREVMEFQALFEAYKKGEEPKMLTASAQMPASAPAADNKAPKADNQTNVNNSAKRKELEAKYKAQCTLSSFEQKYEKELTPIRKRLEKGKKLNARQSSLWNAYSQRLEQVQNRPRCKELSAQIKAL